MRCIEHRDRVVPLVGHVHGMGGGIDRHAAGRRAHRDCRCLGRQPLVTVALQLLGADDRYRAGTEVGRVDASRSTGRSPGLRGASPLGSSGDLCPQLDCFTALQVDASIAESVSSSLLATKRVWCAWSSVSAQGWLPTGMVVVVCPQPDVVMALQVAMSMTDTDAPVEVRGVRGMSTLVEQDRKGCGSTVIDAGTWSHPEVVMALQVAPSITDTRLELFAIPASAT